MKKKYKRNSYLSHKYSGGGFKEFMSSDTGGIISSTVKAIGEGLDAIGDMRRQKWEEEQQQQMLDSKRDQQAYKDRLGMMSSLQDSRNTNLEAWNRMYADMQKKQANSLDPNHKFFIGGLVQAGIALDKGAGSAIGGEYHTGFGDAVSKIPGLGLVGGLANAMFGIKENKAELERVKSDRANLINSANAASAATSFDDSSLKGLQAVNLDVNAYEDGWFTNSAEGKNKAEEDKLLAAKSYAERAIKQSVSNIAGTQSDMLQASYSAEGGPLFTKGAIWDNGINIIGNGGTHELNPYEGVQMGIAPDGLPNLVEEGEVIYDNYVFSNRLKPTKEIRTKYKLRDNITYADAAKKLQKESEERPNDPISKRGLDSFMADLAYNQEELKRAKEAKKLRKQLNNLSDEELLALQNAHSTQESFKCGGRMKHKYAKGGPKGMLYTEEGDGDGYLDTMGSKAAGISTDIIEDEAIRAVTEDNYEDNNNDTKQKPSKYNTWLRYAPIAAGGLGFIGSLFDTPNHEYADAMPRTSDMIVPTVSFRPLGDYLKYTPFDRNYYLNQVRSSAAANRRSIANLSGGNRGTAMAGILASDYNLIQNMGKLAREAEEYNLAQRHKVGEFNRATNMFNSEGLFKADAANQAALTIAAESRFKGALAAAEMKQAEDSRYRSGIYGNLSNLADNLGNLGYENLNRNMVNTNEALRYLSTPEGMSAYKEFLEKESKKSKKDNG